MDRELLLNLLVCLECKGELEDKKTHFQCKNCKKKYEIIDGEIINMLD